MDRRAWLEERRAAVELDYTQDAPSYDIDLYPISEAHRQFVTRVVDACPADGVVLDIPCGTGRYFELVVALGRRVVGADQSAGMVEQARARGLAESVEQTGLQELAHVATFDGVLCIDAMEHVPPEDWPRVVHNLGRACRDGGLVYMSLEVLADQQAHLDRALAAALARGLARRPRRGRGGRHRRVPLLPGRRADQGVAGRRSDADRRGHDGHDLRRLGLPPPAATDAQSATRNT